MDNKPSMLKATMIGGLSFGVAGAIPLINMLNCLCCALIIAGGFLAAFLYSKECSAAGVEFRPGNGALIGLVAGLFYSVANAFTGGLVAAVFGGPDIEQMRDMFEQFDLPPEAMDTALRFMETSGSFIGIMIAFFFTLLFAAIFSTIGGLIGGAVFKVEPPPPASPAPPTPSAPLGGGPGGGAPPMT